MNSEQKHREAILLSIAALLGVGVYNYGELVSILNSLKFTCQFFFKLAHPILNALNGTSKEWLRGVLDSVNAGDWEGFQKVERTILIPFISMFFKHKPQLIREFPETEKAMGELEQKLRLLCLMEVG